MGKGGKQGKGKPSPFWTCIACGFQHPHYRSSCDWCYQKFINDQFSAPQPNSGAFAGNRRWGNNNNNNKARNSDNRFDRNPNSNNQAQPQSSSPPPSRAGKGKGLRARPRSGQAGDPSDKSAAADKSNVVDPVFFKEILKKFNIDDKVADNISQEVASSCKKDEEVVPPKHGWQLIQSNRDKLKTLDKSISSANNALDELYALQETKEQQRDKLVEQRHEVAANLHTLEKDMFPTSSPAESSVKEMFSWINSFKLAIDKGSQQVPPEVLNKLISELPNVGRVSACQGGAAAAELPDCDMDTKPPAGEADASAKPARRRGSKSPASEPEDQARSRARDRSRSPPPG